MNILNLVKFFVCEICALVPAIKSDTLHYTKFIIMLSWSRVHDVFIYILSKKSQCEHS